MIMINQKNKGFSLLEVSIALMVLIVLTTTAVKVVKNTRDHDYLVENEVYMDNVRNALMIFVKVNGFLPCPAADGDGRESRDVGPGAPGFACTTDQGKIPYLDLGVSSMDAWGQPLLYAINARADRNGVLDADPNASASFFNNQAAPVFNFGTLPLGRDSAGNENRGSGNYRVCGEKMLLSSACASTTDNEDLLEAAAIAVVVSFGQNGATTWNEINSGVSAGLDVAEVENMDDDLNFWKASGSKREGQEFDDQLFWILGGDVKYAIISSGGQL